jgi:hypothetical protein
MSHYSASVLRGFESSDQDDADDLRVDCRYGEGVGTVKNDEEAD